ncbi:hypothetical protein ITP53_11050 [Nonomuraea sp. K274]|uniref:Uncharacterized protein n=1 Tax=Nonomuraea cypriaca TaxID=1187855 RepID=A0A931EW30_9ACTN|nr:hypothetical protein [Nonomuraea cypriaca]MBF8186274.1 hypothetical protein [Nonomuraea cypriaca]
MPRTRRVVVVLAVLITVIFFWATLTGYGSTMLIAGTMALLTAAIEELVRVALQYCERMA